MGNLFNTALAEMLTPQKRSGSLTGSLSSFLPFNLSDSGKKVNTHTSLGLSPFFCAINTIANSLALLPMSVFIEDGKNKNLLKDHPVNYLIYREPNAYMTAFTFKFILVKDIFLKGNAYARIERNTAGAVSALQYVDPSEVNVVDFNGKLYYKFRGKTYSQDEMIHIPGFSFDGINGKSIIHFAADNLGVTLSAQSFAGDAYSDRGVSYGVIESDLSLNADKKKEISTAFESRMASGKKFRAPMLDEGMKYKSVTLTPAEAQFVETYMSGIGDIARWFNIPLHKLHVSGEGGYNFLVQMSIEYVQTAVMPIAEKFKQEFERKVYTAGERKKGLHINLNYRKLLQADPKARGEYYQRLYYLGAISADEIRRLEDMNPRDDGGGEDFVQMSNVLNEMQLKKQIQNEDTGSGSN